MDEQEKAEEQSILTAKPAQVRMTIHITRKATGLTETHELIGVPVEEEPAQEQ
jgi:hypothetical protein